MCPSSITFADFCLLSADRGPRDHDIAAAMVTHFRFVRDHHKHIKKVAVVTDSHIGDFAEHLASHFVSAKIRHFPDGQIEQARQWIINGS
jgi:hypothetical protein